MDVLLIKIFLLFFCANQAKAKPNSVNDEILSRYIVFPGLDAGVEEVNEWYTGFTTPFNVFFGPKPYVLGWVAENSFASEGEDDSIEEETESEDYEEEEEEEEEEEIESGEEVEEEEPDYDYKKV